MAHNRCHHRPPHATPKRGAASHLRRRQGVVAPYRKARRARRLGRAYRNSHPRARRRLPRLPRLRPPPNPRDLRRSRPANAAPRTRTAPVPGKKYRLRARRTKPPRPPILLPLQPRPGPNRPPESDRHRRRAQLPRPLHRLRLRPFILSLKGSHVGRRRYSFLSVFIAEIDAALLAGTMAATNADTATYGSDASVVGATFVVEGHPFTVIVPCHTRWLSTA